METAKDSLCRWYVGTLWLKMKDIEWDVDSLDDFHTVLVKDDGERTIKRLPSSMTDELARLTPEPISSAAGHGPPPRPKKRKSVIKIFEHNRTYIYKISSKFPCVCRHF
jgi:hypothetical protein